MRKLLFGIPVVLSLLLLTGQWYCQPIPFPAVPVHAISKADIHAELRREQKQKEIERAEVLAAHTFRSHGCSSSLAHITAVNAVNNGISARLSAAVIIVESSCQQYAVNKKSGAVGYMQVMPKVHHLSRSKLFEREFNIWFGTRYLAGLVHQFGLEAGVANYYGITPGSSTAWDYADHVLQVAGYRSQGGG